MRVLLRSFFCLLAVTPLTTLAADKPDAIPAPLVSRFDGNPRRTPVVDVVQRMRGAVVNIHSERVAQGALPEELLALAPTQNRINGMGTGIVIDPAGYIITNHHVVEDVNVIRVRLADGTTASAKVASRDSANDLALLKIDINRPLPVMPMGTATDLMVGETVVAIGNAYGYDHTVTVGAVSATRRDVTLNKEISYKGLIQTDASINPGNSGGPLLNIKGELVGVNVAIRAGAQGIGFAIPVDSMLQVAADMMSVRKRLNLRHGLVVRDQLTSLESGLKREVVVEQVEVGGPATPAGFQTNDVIHKVGKEVVSSRLDMERLLGDFSAGQKIAIEVVRGGKDVALEIVLEEIKGQPAAPAVLGDLAWRKAGLKLEKASTEVVSKANPQLHGGMVVTEVRSEGPAGKAGFQKGDILVGLHQWEMLTEENVTFVLNHPDLATFNPIRFYIIRSGQVHRGWLPLAD